jgi:hypothetical protein
VLKHHVLLRLFLREIPKKKPEANVWCHLVGVKLLSEPRGTAWQTDLQKVHPNQAGAKTIMGIIFSDVHIVNQEKATQG